MMLRPLPFVCQHGGVPGKSELKDAVMRDEYATISEGLRSERPTVLADSPDLNTTDRAVVWMSDVRVYSFCLMFSVSVLIRDLDMNLVLGDEFPGHQSDSTAVVKLGIEFSDGTAVALDSPARDGILFEVREASGHQGSLKADVLLGPIPPPGPLQFITAIPRLGVSESVVTLDGEHIASASSNVERLWIGKSTSQGLGGAGLRGGGWFTKWD